MSPDIGKLIYQGVEYPVYAIETCNDALGFHLKADAMLPRDSLIRAQDDLFAFAKTGAPLAILAEGNVNDHAWVDNSPTYSAVLAARDERAVPRLRDQKTWKGKRPASLNDFANEVHADNQHWWHDPATGVKLDRNFKEMLMLVVSEIAECMEGERKNLMDDHLPHRRMAEVELADAVIRLADIAGSRLGVDLDYAPLFSGVFSPNKGSALFEIVETISHIVGDTDLIAVSIREIEAYADYYGYDLWGAVAEKREYNKHRADHKPEARLAANGKKF